MTKKEMKRVLSNYAEIRAAMSEGQKETVIKKYRFSEKIKIPDYARGIEKGMNLLLGSESRIVCEIIELSYLKGYKDREIIMRLPVSDSGYYRIKKCVEEKLYELCTVYGYVSESDVTANKI